MFLYGLYDSHRNRQQNNRMTADCPAVGNSLEQRFRLGIVKEWDLSVMKLVKY